MARPDLSLRLLASQYLRRQLKQLTSQFEGIRRAEDIECLHRARVACRRLRNGLDLFGRCFGGRAAAWDKDLRRLARGLGDARDKDVQIEYACQALRGCGEAAAIPGIARVLGRWEQARGRLQRAVLEALDRFADGKTARQMRRAMRRAIKCGQRRGASPQDAYVFGQVGPRILQRLEELRTLQDALRRPDDCRGHHLMRIAAKHLRYALEACGPVYGGRLDRFLPPMKRLQSALGELHDCDVWAPELGRILRKERRRIAACYGQEGPMARYSPGIDFLLQDRRARRQQAFAELLAYWNELTGEGLWEALVDTVRWREEPPAPAGDAAAAPPEEAEPARKEAAPSGNGDAGAPQETPEKTTH